MSIKFKCENIEDMTFNIEGKEFKYSECEILSERQVEIAPEFEIILKSKDGNYAEISVLSSKNERGKENITTGTYDGALRDQETAENFAFLAASMPKHS